jgi:hypothetical protein
MNVQMESLGFQQLTGMTSAASLTVPTGADAVLLSADTQAVRWRDDGTAPTASVGMSIRTTDQAFLYTGDLAAIQFIAAVSGAVLNCTYFKMVG